ncbi:DUF6448 family protein [Glycomyces sp. L485]|uniref:DUF6448 family protein n=1 Tax=Glycomyces sp. L485 TaxID=2909235 RepID=UPI001F4A3B9D|nr:DUF6448 family protein [Glycomyces sp. L485]MCH7229586.1 DUF6448 family protein [Glycomyces sp. L485]
MPPHCDSMDGPVATAARRALEESNVALALPFVPESAEAEVRATFHKAQRARESGPEAREVADRYFLETVVRLHREGEGAPYTGLKPAGLDIGPVIPLAEKAIESGSIADLYSFLSAGLRAELENRLRRVGELRAEADSSVPAARRYVEAMLDFEVFAHRLHKSMLSTHH